MRHQPVCAPPDQNIPTEILIRCVGNLIIIGALPFRLGQVGAPLWLLPIYAFVAGLMLTVAEDTGFTTSIFRRKDVRSYAQVRVALIAGFGAVPFAAGLAFAP
jgi:hypothetical protein